MTRAALHASMSAQLVDENNNNDNNNNNNDNNIGGEAREGSGGDSSGGVVFPRNLDGSMRLLARLWARRETLFNVTVRQQQQNENDDHDDDDHDHDHDTRKRCKCFEACFFSLGPLSFSELSGSLFFP
jgi:hypothetical protein